jgi:phenylpropionate dioxygenase-like ring-hydroxylating dioxygenase large terminal subunit
MLKKEENELLVRIGPGTAMGTLLREYWMPALLSSEVPIPDCDPVRVRLLGEDLVGFRDTVGRPGLLGAHCPHRGASLFFGRNEESGLRCVYHGWKFNVDGQCLDMPNEPTESDFKDKIHQLAYPCEERGGVIWAYLGQRRPIPPLPGLEWLGLEPGQRYAARRVQFCNWVQALEGDIDQSHVSFLHRTLTPENGSTRHSNVDRIRTADTRPRFAALDTTAGVLIGAARDAGDAQQYWRITQFLLPFWSMTGPYGDNPIRHNRAWVPIDDEATLVFSVTFHPLRDLEEAELARMRKGTGAGYVGEANLLPRKSAPSGAWIPKANKSNDYFLDRSLQRTTLFSGIPEFWAQDAAMQEGMGVIFDRGREHLGTSDMGIIRVRQRLLGEARLRAESGQPPASALDPDLYGVRGAAVLLPESAAWVEATEDLRKVRPGYNPAGV